MVGRAPAPAPAASTLPPSFPPLSLSGCTLIKDEIVAARRARAQSEVDGRTEADGRSTRAAFHFARGACPIRRSSCPENGGVSYRVGRSPTQLLPHLQNSDGQIGDGRRRTFVRRQSWGEAAPAMRPRAARPAKSVRAGGGLSCNYQRRAKSLIVWFDAASLSRRCANQL